MRGGVRRPRGAGTETEGKEPVTGRRIVIIGSDCRTRHRLAALVAAFVGVPLIQDPRRSPGPPLVDVVNGPPHRKAAALRSWVNVTARRQALAVERAGSFLANGSVLPALLLALSWRLDDTDITEAALDSLSLLDTALVVAPTRSCPSVAVESVLRRQVPDMRFVRVAADRGDSLEAARHARDALQGSREPRRPRRRV